MCNFSPSTLAKLHGAQSVSMESFPVDAPTAPSSLALQAGPRPSVGAVDTPMDPVPATPADRATVHTLTTAHRTARRLNVSLWRVTEADVRLMPGACSEQYVAWLGVPANMALVIEECRGAACPMTNMEADLVAENERLRALVATLLGVAKRWETPSVAFRNTTLEACGRTVRETAELSGVEVGR